MSYAVSIRRRAQEDLETLPRYAYEKVKAALLALAEEPRPSGCRKLKNREGWRVRTGDYRILYEIFDEQRQVLILRIGHRREVYR